MRNKLIISIDGIRKDRLACYNPKAKHISPNIERIAPECVVFDDMMAAATSTGMCFGSIFTGRYSVAFGRRNFGDTDTPFFDNVFSDHEASGYRTFCCLNRRFEVHSNLINAFSRAEFLWTGSLPEDKGPAAKDRSSLRPQEQAEYLIAHLQSVEGPWLAWIHLWGFSAPGERFRGVSGFDYDCRVAELDHAIGLLFDTFRQGAEIFIFADHGYAFFEHERWAYGKDGHNLVQPVIDVPLLIYNGRLKGRNSNLVSLTRLRELIRDSSRSLDLRDEICFCETRYVGQGDKALAIRKGQFKLIYYYDSGVAEFYDLLSDQGESIDYAGGGFHKLIRDASGDHPNLKPYIVRSDWDVLQRTYEELLQLAKDFYEIPLDIKVRHAVGALRKRWKALVAHQVTS